MNDCITSMLFPKDTDTVLNTNVYIVTMLSPTSKMLYMLWARYSPIGSFSVFETNVLAPNNPGDDW